MNLENQSLNDSNENDLILDNNSDDRLSACHEAMRHQLFHDFQPLIRRLISQYGDTPDQREDLQGDIYCLFQSLIDKYDPQRGVPLRAYLVHQLNVSVYTIARKRWRRNGREVSLEVLLESGGEAALIDRSHDEWDQRINQMVIQEELPKAIQRLTPRQRQVVIWRYYDSYEFEEIAELLGVKPATVRSLLRHGLNHLRAYFAKHSEDR